VIAPTKTQPAQNLPLLDGKNACPPEHCGGTSLVRHFVNAHSTAEPTEAQRKAREWLPEAMLFPVVDPNASAEVEDEADSVAEVTDED
jgi:Plasmid pRiA4b ORF-3-like protein